jgi:hypothetical protein
MEKKNELIQNNLNYSLILKNKILWTDFLH